MDSPVQEAYSRTERLTVVMHELLQFCSAVNFGFLQILLDFSSQIRRTALLWQWVEDRLGLREMQRRLHLLWYGFPSFAGWSVVCKVAHYRETFSITKLVVCQLDAYDGRELSGLHRDQNNRLCKNRGAGYRHHCLLQKCWIVLKVHSVKYCSVFVVHIEMFSLKVVKCQSVFLRLIRRWENGLYLEVCVLWGKRLPQDSFGRSPNLQNMQNHNDFYLFNAVLLYTSTNLENQPILAISFETNELSQFFGLPHFYSCHPEEIRLFLKFNVLQTLYTFLPVIVHDRLSPLCLGLGVQTLTVLPQKSFKRYISVKYLEQIIEYWIIPSLPSFIHVVLWIFSKQLGGLQLAH